jgi:heme/copper-type cytochrome/quinol oxidase subunit 3
LNTIILLSSGVTLTFAHRSILAGDNKKAYHGLF